MKEEYVEAVRKQIEVRFTMLRNTLVVVMRSLGGGVDVEDLMPVVFTARDQWAQVVNTDGRVKRSTKTNPFEVREGKNGGGGGGVA